MLLKPSLVWVASLPSPSLPSSCLPSPPLTSPRLPSHSCTHFNLSVPSIPPLRFHTLPRASSVVSSHMAPLLVPVFCRYASQDPWVLLPLFLMALLLPAIVVFCLASSATVNVDCCVQLLTCIPLWRQYGWSHHDSTLLLVYNALYDVKIHVIGYFEIIICLSLLILWVSIRM